MAHFDFPADVDKQQPVWFEGPGNFKEETVEEFSISSQCHQELPTRKSLVRFNNFLACQLDDVAGRNIHTDYVALEVIG